MATLNDVRRFAMALPEVAEHPSYDGQASWTVKGKGFVWERSLRKSDLKELGDDAPAGPILGVRTEDLEMKDAMLASEPGIFFATTHFDGYPAVLVRLKKIELKLLKQVIIDAWLTRAPKRLADAFLERQGSKK